jgi:serine/threonine protein kinase/CHASE2 domain-containing sensor protein
MTENPSLPQTETLVPQPQPPSRPTSRPRSTAFGTQSGQPRRFSVLAHALVVLWATAAAVATATQSNLAQSLERQMQTLLFEMRGPVTAPKSVVILAMDDASMSQGTETYPTDPNRYAFLKPIARWPWQRTAYAEVIDRLMLAGAKAVALDVLLDAPSSYGPEDDQRLQAVLKKYPGRVVLASKYEDVQLREGNQTKLTLANPIFLSASPRSGFINFPISSDGKIHELSSQYPKLVAQAYPTDLSKAFLEIAAQTPSLAEATLQAAKLPYAPPRGQNIYFYGPEGEFEQVPFWHVLDPTNWKEFHLKDGTFKDKIVVIGATAGGGSLQDFQSTPFSGTLLYPSKMAGVELHANAIATLLENKSIAEAFPNPALQGLLVLGIVISAAFLQNAVLALVSARRFRTQLKGSLFRFILAAGMVRLVMAMGIVLTWGGIGYVAFVSSGLILPIAVPMTAIALSGISYFVTASASDYRSKLHLLKILGKFPNSEVVQQILSEYVEFQDLLQEPEQQVFGKKLRGHYQITRILGSGGFGKTYIAEDIDRPGNPLCVVKQLKPASDNPNLLQLARRLFNQEAQALEALGKKHSQIPQLLAYFEEEGEFYLVQEFVRGKPLSTELSLLGKQLSEARVVAILQDLLQILDFVHNKGVIHRDIKPSNIIWRETDGKLVLIDFGAVKISEQEEADEQSVVTVGIGTKGYMPSEQSAGKPKPNSDIYAIGMIGIQALTGLFPSKLREREDPRTGEIVWRDKARVSYALADVLDQMVRYDYRKRYQTAAEALDALRKLPVTSPSLAVDETSMPPILSEDSDTSITEATKPWPQTFDSAPDLPNTEIPPEESDDKNNSK